MAKNTTRRDLVKGAALAAGGFAMLRSGKAEAQETTRPPAHDEELKFLLDAHWVPPEIEPKLEAALAFGRAIGTDPAQAAIYQKDPAAFWARLGYPDPGFYKDDLFVRTVLLFQDPMARALAEKQDVAGFLRFCEEQGIFALPSSSVLADMMATQLREKTSPEVAALITGEQGDPATEAFFPFAVVAVVVAAVWAYVVAVSHVAVAAAFVVFFLVYFIPSMEQSSMLPANNFAWHLAECVGGTTFAEQLVDTTLQSLADRIVDALKLAASFPDVAAKLPARLDFVEVRSRILHMLKDDYCTATAGLGS